MFTHCLNHHSHLLFATLSTKLPCLAGAWLSKHITSKSLAKLTIRVLHVAEISLSLSLCHTHTHTHTHAHDNTRFLSVSLVLSFQTVEKFGKELLLDSLNTWGQTNCSKQKDTDCPCCFKCLGSHENKMGQITHTQMIFHKLTSTTENDKVQKG